MYCFTLVGVFSAKRNGNGKVVIMKGCLGYVTARRGMLMLHSGAYIDDAVGINDDVNHSAVIHALFQN